MNLKHIHNEPHFVLSKLKEILGYKDMRSVIEWCEKNGVYIMHQGNRQVVNSCEFLLSFYKPFINHLKSKHENWKELFINYLDGNLVEILSCSASKILPSKPYRAKSVNEKSFLQKLKDL